jgi:hypothetical protein
MNRKLSRAAIALAWAVVGGVPGVRSTAAPLPAVAAFELGEPRPQPGIPGSPIAASSGATVGWSFTPSVGIDVLSLGFFDMGGDGLNQPHLVGVWDSAGELVISAQISSGTTNPLLGAYRYAQVKPTRLLAGDTYIIGATVPLGLFVTSFPEGPEDALDMDLYPYHNAIPETITLDSHVYVDANALHFSGSAGPAGTLGPDQLNLPVEENVDGYYFAPNFRFEPVPEPLGVFIVTIGAVPVLARRLARQRRRSTSRIRGNSA